MKYRKKPVVIDAIRWSGSEADVQEALRFLADGHENFLHLPGDGVHIGSGVGYTPGLGTIDIPTLEGVLVASPGDWIIRGVKGEFYPCKPDIFEAIYEGPLSVEEGGQT